MKKMLFSAAALLCSVAAMAQAPASVLSATAKAAATERKQEAKPKQHDRDGDDRDNDKAAKPDNHGQKVSAFAKTTPLTGADKGAAVSALARSGRSTAQGQRPDHAPRSARGSEHGARGGRTTSSSHATSGHAGVGHGRGH